MSKLLPPPPLQRLRDRRRRRGDLLRLCIYDAAHDADAAWFDSSFFVVAAKQESQAVFDAAFEKGV